MIIMTQQRTSSGFFAVGGGAGRGGAPLGPFTDLLLRSTTPRADGDDGPRWSRPIPRKSRLSSSAGSADPPATLGIGGLAGLRARLCPADTTDRPALFYGPICRPQRVGGCMAACSLHT